MGTFFRITIVAGQFRTTVRYITCTAGISHSALMVSQICTFTALGFGAEPGNFPLEMTVACFDLAQFFLHVAEMKHFTKARFTGISPPFCYDLTITRADS